jgi:moderate conductance mechanosensitive channel
MPLARLRRLGRLTRSTEHAKGWGNVDLLVLAAKVSLLITGITDTIDIVELPNDTATWLSDWGVRAGTWLISATLSIGVIVLISLGLLRLLRSVVRRTVERVMERHDQPARELTLKANTLANVIESAGRMVVFIIATMMILSNLGLDIGPLLASAGVAGIALGFGAQSLIRDLINGFFILLEDQYSVGDVVMVNGDSGLVEHLSLRRTALRALNGTVIIIPNGDIRTVSNLTKDWARAVLDIAISYDDDIDHAMDVIREELADVENDPEIGDVIIAPAEILGVTELGQYQVMIRAWLKTKPMEQWRVQRELLRRIKKTLDRNGITIPYPHNVTIYRAENGAPVPDPVVLGQLSERERARPGDRPVRKSRRSPEESGA